MNWYKSAINLGWHDQGLYHFINTIKLEIDNYPALTMDNGEGAVGSTRINFKIFKDDGTKYNFAIKMNANKIETSIIATPLRNIDFQTYDAYRSEPQEIIQNGLVAIDNDNSGDFEHGMV